MDRLSKGFAVFFILIMAISSLIIAVSPASAQTLPTPSVPQFSLKFVDSSYDVPATVTTDPYTGQNTTTQGYHVQQSTLEIIIQNQPLVYQQFQGGNFFFYNVNFKGHFEPNWIQWFLPEDMPVANASGPQTVITLGTLGDNKLFLKGDTIVASNGSVDFQAEALIGSIGKNMPPGYGWGFFGQTSGWSSTQTITVPTSPTSPTPTPTSSPTVPEFPSWAIPLLLSLMVTAAGLLVYFKKHNRKT